MSTIPPQHTRQVKLPVAEPLKLQTDNCGSFDSKMCRCAVIKCSAALLIFAVVSSTSTPDKDSHSQKITSSSHITDIIEPSSLVSGDYTDQLREYPSIADPTNHYNIDKRWAVSYGPKIEPRLLFPVYSAPRPRPGLPTKGYGPPKGPPISYPAARPPQPVYRPKPNRPQQAYGPPKPVGYPASSNQQNIDEVYITYPPATAVSYPQTASHNNNPGGSYGPVQAGYPSTASAASGAGYLPPPSTSKPNYGLPISFPNPNYETPTSGYVSPPVTNKPYATTPSYSTGQTSYPGYPASQSSGGGSYNSGYPSSAGSYKPPTPSYPSSSGGSYHQGSTAPVFVFIPKPGYFNSGQSGYQQQKPGNYRPSGTYPAARPPQTQYYPAPQKPLKPSGVYPPAKAPSTAYGAPKPQRPAYAGTSYRTDIHSNYNEKDDFSKTRQPFEIQQEAVSKPTKFSASSQPNLFQRGNSLSAAAQNDRGNRSWPIGADSSQIVTITELPSIDLSNLPSNKKIPTKNDCGGSWVVLEHPVGGYVDPTKVQIEPIFPPFENSIVGGFRPNGQLFRSPEGPGASFVTFPPGINGLTATEASNIGQPDLLHNVFIFSTTPIPKPEEISDGSWRKPNSLGPGPPFFFSRPVSSDEIKVPSETDQTIFSNGIAVSNPDASIHTSTGNSLIFSVNTLRNTKGNKGPSPFLANVSPITLGEEKIASSSVGDNDVLFDGQSNSSSADDADRLIRLLRSANLRALAALISQADIGALFQDKGQEFN